MTSRPSFFAGALALGMMVCAAGAADAQVVDSDNDGVPDSTDAEPCNPNVVSLAFAPAEGQSSSMLFEDQWTSKGDLDFNDVALAYNYVYEQNAAGQVTKLIATYEAVALGGIFDNGFGLQLPVLATQVGSVTRRIGGGPVAPLTVSSADAQATVFIFDNLRELFGNQAGQINSDPAQARVRGQPFVVEVSFAQPVSLAIAGAPYDVFIYRTQDFGLEIHRPEYSGTSRMNAALFGTGDDASSASRHFVDTNGLPFALIFPTAVPYPREAVSISTAFPDIVAFASSGGTQNTDFYQTNVNPSALYVDVNGNGPLPPTPPQTRVPDTSCVNVTPNPNVDGGPDATIDEGSPLTQPGSFTDSYGTTWTGTVDYGTGTGAVALALAADKSFTLSTTYPDDGTFQISVMVTADDGRVGTDQVDVTVRNVPPTVAAGPDANLNAGQTLTQAGTVTDPGADTVTATVDYGDGGGAALLPIAADGSFTLSHLYSTGGTFQVTVVATDDDGGTAQDTVTVTVASTTPQVDIGADAGLSEGGTFIQLGSFTDPGPGPYTATVDYGDGSGALPLAIGPSQSLSLNHTYLADGSFTVTVAVTDEVGLVGTDTLNVAVLNLAPTLTVGGPATVEVGAAFTRAGAAADAGADPLTATVDYGDGTGAQALAIAADGSFALSHTYSTAGTFNVLVTVTDDAGASSQASLTVTAVSGLPIVSAGADATQNEGGTLTRAVTFTDAQGPWTATVDYGDGGGAQAVSIGAGNSIALSHVYPDDGGFPVTVAVTDPTGNVGTASFLVTVVNVNPTVSGGMDGAIDEGGTFAQLGSTSDPGADPVAVTVDYGDGSGAQPVTVRADGTFDLSHTYANDGLFTITLSANDGDGGIGSDTVQVTVRNVAPALTFSGTSVINEAGSFTGSGQATDVGAQDVLTATIDYGDGAGAQPLTLAANGTFSVNQPYGDNGSFNVTVVVTDDAGASATQSVALTVQNVAPVVTVSAPGSATINVAINGSGTYTDASTADTHTGTVDFGDGTGAQPLTLSGGSFTFSHTYTIAGSYTGAVTITDDDSGSTVSNFGIAVSAGALVVSAGADANQNEGATLSRSASFGGGQTPFTATVDYGDGAGAQSVAIGAGNSIALSKTYADDGTFSVTVQVTDSLGTSSSDSFFVNVANVIPTVNAGGAATINEGGTFAQTGAVSDPGADTFTATVDYGDGSGAQALTVRPDGTFDLSHAYPNNGVFTVTVDATDDDGGLGTGTTSVTVLNVAPTLTLTHTTVVPEGTVFFLTGQGADVGAQDVLTATIDYGDGSGPQPLTVAADGSFASNRTFPDDANLNVTVVVTDDAGASASQGFALTVTNVAPTVVVTGPGSATVGGAASGSGTFADAGSADTHTGTVDFGDGTGAQPLTLSAGAFTFSHPYGTAGTFNGTVTIVDDDGGSVSAGFSVTVAPAALVVSAGADANQSEGATLSRSVSFAGGQSPFTATVDYGDGAGAQSVAIGAGNSIGLSQTYADDGTFTVTVQVTDALGTSSSDSFFANVANVIPTVAAGADATIDEGGTFAQSGAITDPGADTFTATVDYGDGTASQAVAVRPDGTFDLSHTYPNNGAFTVTVTATDDDGGVGSDVAVVTVRNVAPTISISGGTSIPEGAGFSASGQATDVGAQDTLTATIDYGDGTGVQPLNLGINGTFSVNRTFTDDGNFNVTVTVTDDAGASASQTTALTVTNRNPTVSVTGPGSATLGVAANGNGVYADAGAADTHTGTIDFGDGTGVQPLTLSGGSFTFSHTYGTAGTFNGTVTIVDDDGGSASDTFTVTVSASALVVSAGADASQNEGTTLTRTVSFGGGQAPFTATVDYGDGGGAQSVAVSGTSIALSHLYADDGAFTVTVVVTDSLGSSANGTFAANVANLNPTVLGGMDGTIDEGGTFAQLGSTSDVPADTVTVSADYGDGSGAQALTVRPDGTFDISHQYGNDGLFTLTLTATDDDGGVGTDTVLVTVRNVGPTIGFSGVTQMAEGSAFTANGQATDPGLQEVLTGVIDYGDGTGQQPLTIAADGTFSVSRVYPDNGNFTVTIAVFDDGGLGSAGSLPLTVLNVGPAVSLSLPGGGGTVGSPYSGTGTYTDPGTADTHTAVANYGDGTGNQPVTIGGGTLSFTHTFASAGTFGATLTVTDDDGASSIVSWSITVINLTCPAGFGNCDGNASNGCETDISTLSNCGACGNVCDTTNASAACTAGACVLTCSAGFADCDGSAANGCEVSLGSDTNCGACGDVCGAGFACNGSTCGIQCPAGFADCDADNLTCETDLSLPTDCGACGNVCNLANSISVCNAGACGVSSCTTGYGDCDANPANGCEADLLASVTSCGACGTVCATGETCNAGVCQQGSQPPSNLPEVCDGNDNDGDGQIDEGLTVACSSACGAGTIACVAGSWGNCSAALPADEVCNGVDDDCDGIVDNGIYPACPTPDCSNNNGVVPVTAIASPAADAVVASTIDIIGTISDTDLDSWILEIMPAGSSTWRTLATGTTVVANARLATFAPSTVPNGIATLRLRAIDCSNSGPVITRSINVQGVNKLGSAYFAFEDMQVNVNGVPMTVKRVYDSKKAHEVGDFGYGWNLEVAPEVAIGRNRRLGDGWDLTCPIIFGSPNAAELLNHTIEVRLNDFEFYKFSLQVTNIAYLGGGCTGRLSFTNAGGWPGTLTPVGGPIPVWELNGYGNVLMYDGAFDVVDIGNVDLVTAKGDRYRINTSGAVSSVTDAFGNTVTISSSAVTHSQGVSLNMARDPQGRVTSLTGPSGETRSYTYDAAGNLASTTDPNGGTETFNYQAGHMLESYDDAAGNPASRQEYDASGRMTKVVDANQNGRDLSFDDANNATTITDSTGAATALGFDAAGNMTSASQNGTLTTAYAYDARGNVTQEIDPNGGVITRTFDANNNVISETNAAGETTGHAISYAAGGRKASETITYGDGSTKAVVYTTGEKPSQVTHESGLVNQVGYDTSGRRTSISSVANGVTSVTTMAYDASGRATRVVDPQGRVVTSGYDTSGRVTGTGRTRTLVDGTAVTDSRGYNYDARGHVTVRQNAAGQSSTAQRDANGELASFVDYSGRTTTFERDPSGRVTRTIKGGVSEWKVLDAEGRLTGKLDDDGVFTSFGYDATGKLTSAVDALGNGTTSQYDSAGRLTRQLTNGVPKDWRYDAAGRVTQVTDGLGRSKTYAHDARGRVTSMTDAAGRTTTFARSPAGRVTLTTHPDGTTASLQYDARGNLTQATDENGRTAIFSYDSVGNITASSDTAGVGASFGYDEAGNMTSMTDAAARTTQWGYDAAGNRTSEQLPGGQTRTYAFDGAGRVTGGVDFDGTVLAWFYDGAGNLTRRSANGVDITNETRSGSGRLETATESLGLTTFSYDPLGRMTSKANPTLGTITYGYDTDNRITSRATSAGTVSYGYDVLGRLSAVTDHLGGATTYAYSATDDLTRVGLPNGRSIDYGYDLRGRVTLITHRDALNVADASFAYSLDPSGRRTQVVETVQGVASTRTFAYDTAYRLTAETGPYGNLTYAYDQVGNRTSVTGASGTTTFLYDANDQLTSIGGVTRGYDLKGNLTSVGTGVSQTTYAYDARNQLTSVTLPNGTTTTLAYDTRGNRVRRTEGAVQTDFLIDETFEYAQVLLEQRGAASTPYVHGHAPISAGGAGSQVFLLRDAQSVRLLANGTGALTGDSYDYDGFGQTVASSGSTPMSAGFHDHWNEGGTGLIYMRARHYEALAGRFLSRDTIAVDAQDFRNRHPYSYPGADPVNFVDASGRFIPILLTGLRIGFWLGFLRALIVSITRIAELHNVQTIAWNWATDSGLPGEFSLGPSDAFRHIAATAILAQGVSLLALGVAQAREGYTNDFEHNMDRHNNYLGWQYGETHPYGTYPAIGSFLISKINGSPCKTTQCSGTPGTYPSGAAAYSYHDPATWPADWASRVQTTANRNAWLFRGCTGPGDWKPGC